MSFFRNFLVLMALIWPLGLQAQSNSPIPLNHHFFEILPDDSINHIYNKIVSYTPDSVKIERIFTLENKLVRIERTSPKNPEFREYTLEKFTEDGDLIEKTTVNLANSKYLSTYFHDGQQVGQAMHRGEIKFRIFRLGYDAPKETLYNDFDPNPNEAKKVFYPFISEKVKFYPSELPIFSQEIWIALFINEFGEVTQIEWANPLGCEERFVEKYLKAIKSWKYEFTPALDHLGNPKSQWKLFHFHFGSPKPSE